MVDLFDQPTGKGSGELILVIGPESGELLLVIGPEEATKWIAAEERWTGRGRVDWTQAVDWARRGLSRAVEYGWNM